MGYNELSEESKFTSNFGMKNLRTNPQNQTALINPSEMDSPLVRRTYPLDQEATCSLRIGELVEHNLLQ